MSKFIFETTARVICEIDGALRLGALCRELKAERVLLISDPGLLRAGLLDAPLQAMRDSGLQVTLYSDVQADPPAASVQDAVEVARQCRAQVVIGLGGGSSLDTAKLVALLCGQTQFLEDIYGIGLAKGPRLPLIQVPTTAGTGSEVTAVAIVTTPSHEKKGVVSPLLYPDIALLDARLTVGLPPAVSAMTGVDAMVHAIEAYTSVHKKNVLSDGLAVQALTLLAANMDRVLAEPDDLQARSDMLLGSMLAGMAFANAPVAAVHALAYPLGGHFHVPHGLSNALVLVPVLNFNRSAAEPLYAQLAAAVLPGQRFASAAEACDGFIDFMTRLVARMPFAQRLHEVGVTPEDLDRLTDDALKVERLLINNPRPLDRDDIYSIYASVL
ncbi:MULTISPECIES: iron-containing alcohol dehydrogenase [Pseudomonas]|uniref:Alcohol dehydrogenase, class IV n=1 Tax=Pseudomonas psychrophila TaxID=122355 RepID=A0ABY0VRT3_9PSED|nr:MULTISPECIES: iron-containing alcohol dehydrogenase [Pseudomonas]KAB0488991.1 iron-containing alcohol dehydrogenase [Pseudomonas psychrophila]KMN02356.1 alcohol dehydrogenase [Pseudomonas psychrophila]MDY7584404.1 iron-containing alcohol dehydrogenase [Pseudomonas sp. CCI3.1]MEB0069485.1 iron-containing alcohol dehydrogenase [Pseudomonas sp. CCI3.1]MEB0074101.1 iron-containing alcohol dehydrogenase [Pseudomonas sp. CCI1.4]